MAKKFKLDGRRCKQWKFDGKEVTVMESYNKHHVFINGCILNKLEILEFLDFIAELTGIAINTDKDDDEYEQLISMYK